MRLGDVGDMKSILADSCLAADPLWGKGSDLTPIDIQLFYARSGLKAQRQHAIDLVGTAQALVVKALSDGLLKDGSFASLVIHELPVTPYLADEFVDSLIKLRPSRRGACIYALECKLDPLVVTELYWMGLDVRQASRFALEAINVARTQRHVRLPYVFWEWATPNIASPLLGLQKTIEEAFGCGMSQLQERYDRMVMVNRSADAASFLEIAGQLDKGQG